GNYFCFTSGRTGHDEIWKMTVTGDSLQQLTFDENGNMHPNWSPMGDFIAYDSEKSGNQDVWILPLSGGNHVQFTTNPLRDESLCWNHDGSEILFDSNRSGGNWDIWKKAVSGGNAIRLTTHSANESQPAVSPNGEKIAFISFRSGNCDIWLMDYDGSNQVQLTNNAYFEGTICWSPDGEYLAYLADNAGNFDIWILPLAGGEPIQFTTHTAADMHPCWSPDGSLIAFSSNRSGNEEVWSKEFTSWLYLGQPTPGLIPERFPPDDLLGNSTWFWHGPPVFSPDGRELFMSRYYIAESNVLIYSMELIGIEWTSPEIPGFCGDYSCNSPSFTSSGDTLFFISERPETAIYFTTKSANSWSDPIEVDIPVPAPSTFGNSVSVAGNGTLYFELNVSGDLDLYKSEFLNGQYSEPVNLGPSVNSSDLDFGPYVDPDELYLIFSSRRNGGYGESDLYISAKNLNGEWTEPQNLGSVINSDQDDFGPTVTRDGNYFFFCTQKGNDEGYNPYWVDADVLDPFLITGIKDNRKEDIFHLSPNPFTNSTTIEYQVNDHSKVSLRIFDNQGSEIKTLVEGYQTPGNKTIRWDGTNNSRQSVCAGVYYCRIRTGNQMNCKKMLFLDQ
nr:PD40 domain-containing protein [Bacteroidota bacterium]